jgi:hypothetical protein
MIGQTGGEKKTTRMFTAEQLVARPIYWRSIASNLGSSDPGSLQASSLSAGDNILPVPREKKFRAIARAPNADELD